MRAQASPFRFDDLATVSPSPGYSQADLDAAREEGKCEAVREKRAEQEATQHRLLKTIVDKIEETQSEYERALKAHCNALTACAAALVKQVATSAHDAAPASRALEIIDAYLSATPANAPARLRLPADASPALVKQLSERLAARGAENFIEIVKDKKIDVGDCRLDWRGGALVSAIKDIHSQIDAHFAATACAADTDYAKQETPS